MEENFFLMVLVTGLKHLLVVASYVVAHCHLDLFGWIIKQSHAPLVKFEV